MAIALAASPATPAPGPVPQETARLVLSSAPVEIVYPAAQGSWGRRLASYAEAAVSTYDGIMGTAPGNGRIVWAPEAAAAALPLGTVTVEQGGEGDATTIRFETPLSLLAQDHGVGYATGAARWLVAYAVGRLYFAPRAAADSWWDDGAALYLTELLARRERATTPILYGLESAWSRHARRGEPVDMEGAERGTADAVVRGKAYLTFRLLEAAYGEAVVADALALLAGGGFQGLFRTAIVSALPAGLDPDPDALLRAWLDPGGSLDVAIEDVRTRDGRLTATVVRHGDVPVPVRAELRLASGERRPLTVPAGTGEARIDEAVDSTPVELRLDPEGLLPDTNRGNNLHGFGDAGRIRSFFPLDEQVAIGELHFDGEIRQVGNRRVEEFTVGLENLTEEPVGLGLLVSAQWIDRPIARTQRAVFVVVPAGERRLARDFLVYPRLGRGRARVEARYWRAADTEELTDRILRGAPDLTSSYIVQRDPPAPDTDVGSPLERLEASLEVDSIAELAADTAPAASPDADAPGATPPAGAGTPVDAEPLDLRILSPAADAMPLGELTFEVEAVPDPATVELYVNDRLLATLEERPYRATWTPDEEQDVFVLRAVAVEPSGRVAAATRVLERGVSAFGASVDLVTIYATVKQPGGTLVEDLRAQDFRVVEDGVEQEIVQFSPGEQTAVSVAVLLDTSSSMIGGGITSARAGARRLVESLVRDEDRAMILGFNDRLYLYSDFVSDRARLEQAIAATYPDGSTALYDGIVESLRKVNRRSGRRALVVLSDGLDTQSRFDYPDVMEYVRQSDVVVYTIGLQLMHDATELGDATDEVRDSVERLRALAEVTGGTAYFPLSLDELEGIYGQIAAELEGQYSLSYYPTNQQWDGRWREVQVLLPGHPGLRLQARPGYYGVRPEGR